jgi:ArsR family transcriptional regulator, arsenate/arsenite/antimonite-responsive transcriptional repressor
MRELTKTLKVLSDESRLRVLNLIQERECCVCEVMQVMNISQSKASRICSALYDIGLLKQRRDGRWTYYSLADNASKEYVTDIVSGIKKCLAENPDAAKDIERLKNSQRAGQTCAEGLCDCDNSLTKSN